MTRSPLLASAAVAAAITTTVAGRAWAAPAQSRRPTHLVVVGGGDPPAAAMARFVEWAGGRQARLLVVPWASGEPKESCETLVAELRALGPGSVECAPGTVLDAKGRAAPLEPERRRECLSLLARATGVFFTGGDQARVMDVLADAALLQAMRARYAEGAVFGGTSAGAAIMSPLMITGEGDFTVIDGAQVDTRPGLGLLEGVVVDQHFVKRQRENRLFGLVLMHPELRGIGVDEGTALLVTGGRRAEVVGPGPVMLVDATGPDCLAIGLLRSGQTIDLSDSPGAKTTR
ncbi:MAG TPA: cyanophycinase [Vicinamibacteria bacterium]|nr:cyanophycinase [Vicinamibacteria bacterium]